MIFDEAGVHIFQWKDYNVYKWTDIADLKLVTTGTGKSWYLKLTTRHDTEETLSCDWVEEEGEDIISIFKEQQIYYTQK